MTLFGFFYILILSASHVYGGPQSCAACGISASTVLTQFKSLAQTSCQADLAKYHCADFYRQNEIPPTDQRNCVDDPQTLPFTNNETIKEFGRKCGKGVGTNIFENFEVLGPVVSLYGYSPEQIAQMNSIKTCDQKCKGDLVKPYLNTDLFPNPNPREIIGHKDDAFCHSLLATAPEYQTYCEGQSVQVLFGRIASYMKEKAQQTKTDQQWSVPWSSEPVVTRYVEHVPLTDQIEAAGAEAWDGASHLNETVAIAMLDWLDDKQIKYACYPNKSRLQMGCYGIAAIIGFIPEREAALASEVEKLGILKNSAAALKLRKEFSIRQLFGTNTEKEWYAAAREVEPDGKTVFLHFGNSRLKLINDETKDHVLADALSNKYKEELLKKLEIVKKDHPDLKIVASSDGKSLELAVIPIPPQTAVSNEFKEQVKDAFKQANKEYAEFLTSSGIAPKSAQAENWFRAGIGDTADQASTLAKAAGDRSRENTMLEFSEPAAQRLMSRKLEEFHSLDYQLYGRLRDTDLIERAPLSRQFELKTEVIDMARKNPDDKALAEVLRAQYGDKAASEAAFVRSYVKAKDVFTPNIIANPVSELLPGTKQVIQEAKNGVLNVDLIGQGAINAKATGQVLRVSQDVTKAVKNARLQDAHVTKDLEEKRRQLTVAIDSALGKKVTWSKGVTGDELSFAPDVPLTAKEWKKVSETIAKSVKPSSIRVSVVTEKVSDETLRSKLGYVAEGYEKQARKNATQSNPVLREKMKEVLLQVRMDGQRKTLTIIDNNKEATKLSADEKKLIQKKFREASQ